MKYNRENVNTKLFTVSNLIYNTVKGPQSASGIIVAATRHWIIFDVDEAREIPIKYKDIKKIQ